MDGKKTVEISIEEFHKFKELTERVKKLEKYYREKIDQLEEMQKKFQSGLDLLDKLKKENEPK